MKVIAAVRDAKSESYGRPIMEATVGSAIRAFEQEATNAESPLAKFPHDFALFQIGEYDELTGKIKGIEPQICLAKAWEIQEANKNRTPRI